MNPKNELTDTLLAVVPGGSNTDLIVSPTRLVGPGELASGGRLRIGPGGKSRNVAQMMAAYMGRGRVAFLGRTLAAPRDLGALAARLASADAAGSVTVDDLVPAICGLLAQVPMAALERAGVVTDYVLRTAYEGLAAGTALIPVDESGENTIYVAAGLNDQFSADDMAAAEPVIASIAARAAAAGQRGVMALALEIQQATAIAAARLARRHGLLVVLDMGGMQAGVDYAALVALADVVKPNEHEALMLTDVEVGDAASATRAAEVLHQRCGTRQLVITAGADGAYVMEDGGAARHYPARTIGRVVDTTGCGDQFMAVLCAELALGSTLAAAIEPATIAAGLQAMRSGIDPVERGEVVGRV